MAGRDTLESDTLESLTENVFGRVSIEPGIAVCLFLDFSNPPPKANEKESPVFKKFRWFAFECMSDKLKNPS